MRTSRRAFLTAAGGLPLAASAQSKSLVVDAHCHAGHGQAMAAPWNTFADPKLIVERMVEAGIDRTIIFPIGNETYEQANGEIADICSRYPDKFIGFAKHDPQSEKGRVPELLRREVEQLGLRGLKLHRLPTRDVLDAVAALGIPVLYHPERVANFHIIAAEYPSVAFVMAHMGSFGSEKWTEHIAAIDIAKRYPNVHLETSSILFSKYLRMAVDELGPGRIIFGSDGPEVDSRIEIHKIRALGLSANDEAAVLGGNITKLLPKGSV